jgi:hypothetical protein
MRPLRSGADDGHGPLHDVAVKVDTAEEATAFSRVVRLSYGLSGGDRAETGGPA